MIDMLGEIVTIKTALGIIGSVPGGLRAYTLSRATHSRGRAISDMLIGTVFAASLAEMMTPDKYPSSALLVGLLAGLVGGKALDALSELVPEVVRTLALGWANKVTGGSGADRVRRSTGWGDLSPRDPPPPRPTNRFTRPEADDER